MVAGGTRWPRSGDSFAGCPGTGAGQGHGGAARGRGRPASLLFKLLLRALPAMLGAAGGMYAGRKRKKPVPRRWVRRGTLPAGLRGGRELAVGRARGSGQGCSASCLALIAAGAGWGLSCWAK